jgi:phosphatidylserine/phosphatidylglycerophosphate/cardiolipin synthase-like enzyme
LGFNPLIFVSFSARLSKSWPAIAEPCRFAIIQAQLSPQTLETALLLKPGSTCWRRETADRVGLIIDMADYFAAARAAMRKARRSIHLLNWAFDPDTRFAPDGSGEGDPDGAFGPFLRDLACQRPEVDVRILCWRSALPVAATQNFFPHRAKACFENTPVKFRLDGSLPMGACHHQKVLVVDDEIAFCGGGDIAPDRWDTSLHRDDDLRRRKRPGQFYESRHETMSVVDGAAARALGELFRMRWARSTGEALPAPTRLADGVDLWPDEQPIAFQGATIGLSRTEPQWREYREVREAEALHLAAIAAAKRCIYMENQYFASPIMAEALAARLAEADGPEVILVSTQHSPSWFDQMTMDRTRVLFLKRLKASDPYDRCRAFYPLTEKGRSIIVHSKLTIIDDVLVRVGSANLNNRSTGFDTECDLSVEAADGEAGAKTRAAIHAFRTRLLAHWLHEPAAALEAAIDAEDSLRAAIESFDGPGKLMHPIEIKPIGPFWEIVAHLHLGDPAGPTDSWRPWLRRRELEGQIRTLAERLDAVGLHAPADALSPETV